MSFFLSIASFYFLLSTLYSLLFTLYSNVVIVEKPLFCTNRHKLHTNTHELLRRCIRDNWCVIRGNSCLKDAFSVITNIVYRKVHLISRALSIMSAPSLFLKKMNIRHNKFDKPPRIQQRAYKARMIFVYRCYLGAYDSGLVRGGLENHF